ncbi:DUF3060 domain-containing protein [Mycolicibacterium sp. 120270]|uniref:DUF3060 domain-containing protein n=1 Tax=Mycolicibacterium sp. 120270 TaxID=3090600 RepID=UPI00299E8C40|nr:DUF3060 domain-containing protein [Mycolicibacterium sp. 120270]MDX1884706.1 DUF3060 domain-containing protein [Mycolicibacterium sp. 120270]
MNFEDDPEARIRALEQPLSDQARASELGGAQAGSDAAYLPPPVSAYSPPDPNTPTYGTQDFGTQPYGTQQWGTQQWGAQQWGAAPTKVSGGIPWVIFGMIAVVILVISAGIIVFVTQMTGAPDDSSVPSGGGSIDITLGEPSPIPSVEIPQAPTVPSIPVPGVPAPGPPGADPNGTTAAPGQTVTVSGVDENRTVTCKGGDVSVSGIRNTVTIIGHCAQVAVSGIENNITVDAADKIGASGFDNKVTYHGGTPQIDADGSNTVQQG